MCSLDEDDELEADITACNEERIQNEMKNGVFAKLFQESQLLPDHVKNLLQLGLLNPNVLSEAWRYHLQHVTQLTTAQANAVWFLFRLGVFTSSTTLEMLHICLDDLIRDADPQRSSAATLVAEYLNHIERKQETPLQFDETKLTPSTIDDMTGAELKQLCAYLHKGRQRHDRIKTSGRVVEVQERVKEDLKRTTPLKLIPDTPDARRNGTLISTWFMRKLDEKKIPALSAGRYNEPFIDMNIKNFLYKHSQKRLLILEQKEVGLVEQNENPVCCTSADGLALFTNMQSDSIDVEMMTLEYKTVTELNTINNAKKTCRLLGKLVTCCKSTDAGIYFNPLIQVFISIYVIL